MKTTIISILLILFTYDLIAQVNVKQNVFASMGQFKELTGGLNISVTVGEGFIQTRSLSGGLSVLQGFQQPAELGSMGFNDLANAPFQLKIWPNPANAQLNIELTGEVFHPIQFQLFDGLGRAIDRWKFELSDIGVTTKSVQDLASGIYLLYVFQAEGNFGGVIHILKR